MESVCKFATPAFILLAITGILAISFAEYHYARSAYALCKDISRYKSFTQFIWVFGHYSGMIRKIWFLKRPDVHPDDKQIIEEYAGRSQVVFWVFVGVLVTFFVLSNGACKDV